MPSLASLTQQLKDLLISTHGDFSIYDHPQLYKDLRDAGLDEGDISRFIQRLLAEINWGPIDLIDEELSVPLYKGSISPEQIRHILEKVGDDLPAPTVKSYVISQIKKRGFKPREKNDPDELSFGNLWMTDEAYLLYEKTRTEVEWLGEKANSLKQLAAISFRKKDLAKSYLRNAQYLVSHIVTLTRSSTFAHQFEQIITKETDAEKRFLKIVYKLDPELPFLFLENPYHTVVGLLESAFATHQGFQALQRSFSKGELQVWLEEAYPEIAKTEDRGPNAFLELAYHTLPSIPFYIGNLKFDRPQDLANYIHNHFISWTTISDVISSGSIYHWFSALGLEQWNQELKLAIQNFRDLGFYNDTDLDLGIVQKLKEIINPECPQPFIETDQSVISLPTVEASATASHPVKLRLHNSGYLKAQLSLFNAPAGVTLDTETAVFNSYNQTITQEVKLVIDPLVLVKNQPCYFSILIKSAAAESVLPADITVVFPKKAYLVRLLIYGSIGALILGTTRYILSLLLQNKGWVPNVAAESFSAHTMSLTTLFSLAYLLTFIWLATRFKTRFEKN